MKVENILIEIFRMYWDILYIFICKIGDTIFEECLLFLFCRYNKNNAYFYYFIISHCLNASSFISSSKYYYTRGVKSHRTAKGIQFVSLHIMLHIDSAYIVVGFQQRTLGCYSLKSRKKKLEKNDCPLVAAREDVN